MRDSTPEAGVKISRFRRIPLALRGACFTLRRIRLVAYGARLESVLGASPRGFESPILRHRTPGPLQVPGFLLPVAPLVFRAPLVFWAPSGPAAREIATREPAARKCRSRSPPVPSGPSGALHTGGTCGAWTSPARPRRRSPAPRPGHAALAAKPRGSVVAGNPAVPRC